MVIVTCLIDSFVSFFFLFLSLYAFVHYHHFAAPVILCSLVLLEVWLGLHYLQFVFMLKVQKRVQNTFERLDPQNTT